MDILNIADINVAEYVEYDTPDQTPVWAWIEDNATYTHRKNHDADNCGIWEFVVNTCCITDEDCDVSIEDVPQEIRGAVREAIDNGAAYILFHRGT
ncbi:hypothetical protein KV201_18825 [Shewanella sp. SR1]|uniref:hypothetical protein n=1 Tax=Shewanella sp. SR1 TaxID=2855505 RepID=UPI001CF29317|nr:hypothetical protein [Shewanella sp. SR1]MCB2384215.1 hypothetical protein [Shewanella sp. SR1]